MYKCAQLQFGPKLTKLGPADVRTLTYMHTRYASSGQTPSDMAVDQEVCDVIRGFTGTSNADMYISHHPGTSVRICTLRNSARVSFSHELMVFMPSSCHCAHVHLHRAPHAATPRCGLRGACCPRFKVHESSAALICTCANACCDDPWLVANKTKQREAFAGTRQAPRLRGSANAARYATSALRNHACAAHTDR
jgi:hypothetical protein